MQIQRIQTLWLIISLACAIVSLCFPWLYVADSPVGCSTDTPLLILALLATLLPLLAIFMFRNPQRQQLVCGLTALLAVGSLGYALAQCFLGPDEEARLALLAPIAMALSGIFDVLARNAIRSDIKLLRDSDRIR